MIQLLEPIKEDIIKWTLIITGISFSLAILNLVLTVDITSSSINFLEYFTRKMSDYGFLLGCIAICIGLIFSFFKRPSRKGTKTARNDNFVPKYRTKNFVSQDSKEFKIQSSSSSMFSPRDLKFIFSGLLSIIIAISIWIGYIIADSFLL